MKRFIQMTKSGKVTLIYPHDPVLERSCGGRIIRALTFISIIVCLGLWITAFVLLKDQVFTGKLSGNILTNLTCLTFFGGLVLAIFFGALAGNLLRRIFWKWLIRKRR